MVGDRAGHPPLSGIPFPNFLIAISPPLCRPRLSLQTHALLFSEKIVALRLRVSGSSFKEWAFALARLALRHVRGALVSVDVDLEANRAAVAAPLAIR